MSWCANGIPGDAPHHAEVYRVVRGERKLCARLRSPGTPNQHKSYQHIQSTHAWFVDMFRGRTVPFAQATCAASSRADSSELYGA